MTEQEWPDCNNPQKMLISLARPPADRKMLLFTVACCKRLESQLIDERSHEALSRLERLAEGQLDSTELDEGSKLAYEAIRSIGQSQLELDRRRRSGVPWADLKDEADRLSRLDNAAWAVYAALMGAKHKTLPVPYSYGSIFFINRCRSALKDETDAERQYHAEVLHDLFGNPFSPVALDPAWLTRMMLSLAQQIYDSRGFERLPVLADALEQAGCNNADILAHCRQPGTHVRGCWLIDLVLSKK
jgi:hypothetical protein